MLQPISVGLAEMILTVRLGELAAFSLDEAMEVPRKTLATANLGGMEGRSSGTCEEGRVSGG